MLAPAIAALILASGPQLAPGPAPETAVAPPPVPGLPGDPPPRPLMPAALTAGLLGLAAHAGTRRRTGDQSPPGAALGLAEDPIVVFVGGHGTEGAPEFGPLIDLMDLDPEQARFFDYRWVVDDADQVTASQIASIDATADALNAYLAGLHVPGRPILLVGFSKGGAGIAELVARWDDGSPVRVDAVRGAVLLDPPLASGWHGLLQSVGRLWGPLPDDGGYDPITCDILGGCRDRRAHLGEASGVEVLVIRNPRAGVTSFGDHPEGLRVIDVADGGPGPLAALLADPFGFPARMAEAHNAVLSDERVARCIAAEMHEPGSCDVPERRAPVPPGMWRAGSSGMRSVL